MLADEWSQIVLALGRTVRQVRRLLGWSQQHLANQAVVSQGAISRIETGRCAAVPFHSVVVVLRTLALAADEMGMPLSPAAKELLAFAPSMDGAFAVIEPPDPDLAYIAQTLHRIPRPDRPKFLTIVRAAAAAFHTDESADPDDEDGAPDADG